MFEKAGDLLVSRITESDVNVETTRSTERLVQKLNVIS